MKKCVGVDLGGTTVKLGIVGANGAVFDKWEIPTRTEHNGLHIFPDIAASIREHMSEEELNSPDFAGVGMGVPGPVQEDGYVEKLVNLHMADINVADLLSGLLGKVKVKACNDANAAALGELWMGAGKGYKSLVFITLGTGVGGGVVMNGKVIAGSRGMGGEIGHMTVNPEESETCNCGNHGCLEQYASATGIVNVMKRTLAEYDDPCSLRGLESFECKDVLDAAKAGDVLAVRSVQTSMDYLALAMANIAVLVDPEVFVIGGGVSRAGQYLLDCIEPVYARLTPLCKDKADIAIASLMNDAGLFGAAKLVL